jgi:hypothetical protein
MYLDACMRHAESDSRPQRPEANNAISRHASAARRTA